MYSLLLQCYVKLRYLALAGLDIRAPKGLNERPSSYANLYYVLYIFVLMLFILVLCYCGPGTGGVHTARFVDFFIN